MCFFESAVDNLSDRRCHLLSALPASDAPMSARHSRSILSIVEQWVDNSTSLFCDIEWRWKLCLDAAEHKMRFEIDFAKPLGM